MQYSFKKEVNIDTEHKAKLGRYFRNSSRFLWGLAERNQKETYSWLWRKGYEFNRGSYTDVANQLLEKPGIEKVIMELIIPLVEERFSSEALQALRQCWYTGMLPNVSFLKTYNIRNALPFLEVNTQFNYVERWGEFAGVWFEEIKQS